MYHLPLSVQLSSYSRSRDCKVLVKLYFNYKQTIRDPFLLISFFLHFSLANKKLFLWHNQHPLQTIKFLKGCCCKEPWTDQKEMIGAGEIGMRFFSHIVVTGLNTVFLHFFTFLEDYSISNKMHHVLLVCNTFPALTQHQQARCKLLHLGRPGHSFSLVCCLFSSTFHFPS